MEVGLQKLAFLSHTEMVINPLDSSASWRFSCEGGLLDVSSHLLLQDTHSCAIDGYDELVFILRIRIVLTLHDMDSEGCLYPSSRDNLSTDLGCVLHISFIG